MPYVAHPDFKVKRKNRDATIWRYMDFAKFVSLLDGGALYFPSVQALCKDDPYEGAYGDLYRNLLNMPFELLPKAIVGKGQFTDASLWDGYRKSQKFLVDHTRDLRPSICVSCWHMQAHESGAMWAQYATGGLGIAVVSTLGRLRRALKPSYQEVYIGEVVYADYQKSFPNMAGNIYKPFMHKRYGYEHEREIRALIANHVFGPPSPFDRAGLSVPVDVPALIDAVLVSPTAPSWALPLVESVVRRYGYELRVFKSQFLRPPGEAIDWSPLVNSRAGGGSDEAPASPN